jgi:hypothetical protein
MTINVTETLVAMVDRHTQALGQIPTVETDNWSDEDKREHEERVIRLSEDPEEVIFYEGFNFVAVAQEVVAWLKLPEYEATRERLVRMIALVLTDDDED